MALASEIALTYDGKDGLYFLQLMKWGVLQYCVIRPRSARVHRANGTLPIPVSCESTAEP